MLLVAPRSRDGVANPIRPEDEASIVQLAEHIMSTEQRCVIVIDNLHAADIQQLAIIIRRCPRETTVIAATRDPRAAKMFADALVPTTIINLNVPSLTFIEQLVDYATEYFGVRMTTQRREAFVLEANRFFASPATIVEQLSHYRGMRLRGSHAYATQMRVLPAHGALSRNAARILHVIAYLRATGVRVINPAVLRLYATDCFGSPIMSTRARCGSCTTKGGYGSAEARSAHRTCTAPTCLALPCSTVVSSQQAPTTGASSFSPCAITG